MNLTNTNKTFILCLIYIAGIASVFMKISFWYILVFVILISFFIYKRIISYKFGLVCTAIILFSLFYVNFRTPKPDKLYYIAPVNAMLTGTIITQPDDDAIKKRQD